MESRSAMIQQRRPSVRLYTEFSQNYPTIRIRNLSVQIDDSSHSIRSVTDAETCFQSTAMQTVNRTPNASVQVDLLTRSQSEVTQTEPEMALDILNQSTLIDASVESVEQSGNHEQHTDSFNTLRVYLLNQLPISVLSDESSMKKLSDCSICMENYRIGDRVMGLPCFHMFHHRCLCAWIEKNLQCPVCRMPVYEVD
uniref:RING-type domain-containing protein n=1 Tax=Trichobilharzia regenti TaxID=157069 RepID=A0AA85KP79_TRIRE|nr:unnamed protein product [Trichobilharzia regenti]